MARIVFENDTITEYDDGTEEVRFTEDEWAVMLTDPSFGYVCGRGHRIDERYAAHMGGCRRCDDLAEMDAPDEEVREAVPVHTFTAVFPRQDRAVAFYERITGPGWWVINVARKGNTVTFQEEPGHDDHDCFQSMLETVGYFGSAPGGRQATLDGVKAPRHY